MNIIAAIMPYISGKQLGLSRPLLTSKQQFGDRFRTLLLATLSSLLLQITVAEASTEGAIMQFNSLADYVKTDCTGHDILPIATIIYIKGGVTHRSHQNSRLEKGESIYRGTVVVTDSDGFVAMALNNGETINLQPSTITEFSCAGGISKQAEYKVELSYLSAAIRG